LKYMDNQKNIQQNPWHHKVKKSCLQATIAHDLFFLRSHSSSTHAGQNYGLEDEIFFHTLHMFQWIKYTFLLIQL
jgi:hypothetical protein